MPKISALPPMTTAAADDEAPIVDTSASSTKKWTLTLLKTYLQSLTEWISAGMIENRTRSRMMLLFAEGSGGAASTANGGMPEVGFSGTPTGYARGKIIIPEDYVAGTDVTIRIRIHATNTATHTARRYIRCYSVGDGSSENWNVDSNVQTTGLAFTSMVAKDIDITVAAANIAAGDLLEIAWRIESAITGTVYLQALSLRYTADS